MTKTMEELLRENILVSKSFCRELINLLLILSADIVCKSTEDKFNALRPMKHANAERYQKDVQYCAKRIIDMLRD